MDAFTAYNYGSSGWLALQGLPLVVTPSLIVTLLSVEVHQPTSLEQYFARSLGLAVLFLSLQCLFLAGVFPLTSIGADSSSPELSTSSTDVYAIPTSILTTVYHTSTTFYSYTRYYSTGQAIYMLAALGSGIVSAMGLWALMFGSGSRISKRTGADKRTSGWPFGNSEADKKRVPRKRL